MIRTLTSVLERLTQDRPDERWAVPLTRMGLVRWWETRRFLYNALVGIVGVASWLSVLIFGSLAVKPGVDFEEPLAMVLGPVFWAFVANAAYTSGWILDVSAYTGEPRRKLLRVGLVFSLIVTALPGLWAVFAWLITVATGQKMD